MLSRSEIEKILSAELDAAKHRNIITRNNFQSVIKDVPSGIPIPDGTFRIKTAGIEHREALQELYSALTRYNGFIVRGIIPEDFKKP